MTHKSTIPIKINEAVILSFLSFFSTTTGLETGLYVKSCQIKVMVSSQRSRSFACEGGFVSPFCHVNWVKLWENNKKHSLSQVRSPLCYRKRQYMHTHLVHKYLLHDSHTQFNGINHPKIKILSSFTFHIPYDCATYSIFCFTFV